LLGSPTLYKLSLLSLAFVQIGILDSVFGHLHRLRSLPLYALAIPHLLSSSRTLLVYGAMGMALLVINIVYVRSISFLEPVHRFISFSNLHDAFILTTYTRSQFAKNNISVSSKTSSSNSNNIESSFFAEPNNNTVYELPSNHTNGSTDHLSANDMGQTHSSITHSSSAHAPFKGMAAPASVGGNSQPQLMPQYINSPPNLVGVGRRTSSISPSLTNQVPTGTSTGGGPSFRKGPLIFAAMTPAQQQQPDISVANVSSSATASYPTPPAEYASPPSKRQSRIVSGPSALTSDSRQNHRLSTSSAIKSPKAQPHPGLSSPPPPSSQNPSNSGRSNGKRKSVLQKNGQHQHVVQNGLENYSTVPPPLNAVMNGMKGQFPANHSLSHAGVSSHRTLTKPRLQKQSPSQTSNTKVLPPTPPSIAQTQYAQEIQQRTPPVSPERVISGSGQQVQRSRASAVISNEEFEETGRVAIPLDEDPFARGEGVRMLSPKQHQDHLIPDSRKTSVPSSPSLHSMNDSKVFSASQSEEAENRLSSSSFHPPGEAEAQERDVPGVEDDSSMANADKVRSVTPPTSQSIPPLTPPSPDQYRTARTRRRGDHLPQAPPAEISEISLREDRPAEPFPLILFLSNPALLSVLLGYLTYWDWCIMFSVSKKVREMFGGMREHQSGGNELLKEEVLERFLRTVGYARWIWKDDEPLALSLADLHDYMRGVSIPSFEYARVADTLLQQRSVIPSLRDPSIADKARLMVSATRAYNRVLLRLRAQAEREPLQTENSPYSSRSPPSSTPSNLSHPPSRAPSPSGSLFTRGRSIVHGSGYGHEVAVVLPTASFHSPLFRIGRAPLLRVFVPSPEGDWLSDTSVLACEAELKQALSAAKSRTPQPPR
jgi:hypothetical protein